MSIASSEMVDSGRFPGKRTGRGLEKSNFSQTCNLLSQYLKEKGSLGDLGLGMTQNLDGNGISGLQLRHTAVAAPATTMNLFPQHAGFGSTAPKEELSKKANTVSGDKTEREKAQMTIFYAGQVIVLNDFPADKAKEIMVLASKSTSSPASGPPVATQKVMDSTSVNSNPYAPGHVGKHPVPIFNGNLIRKRPQPRPQPQPKASASDLPLARKISLTRFLEKRKDRLTAGAPYPVDNSSSSVPASTESKSWFGLGAQSQQEFQP